MSLLSSKFPLLIRCGIWFKLSAVMDKPCRTCLVNLSKAIFNPSSFSSAPAQIAFLGFFEHTKLVSASGTLHDLFMNFVQVLWAVISSKWSCPTCLTKRSPHYDPAPSHQLHTISLGSAISFIIPPSPYQWPMLHCMSFAYCHWLPCWNICSGKVVTHLPCSMLCPWVSAL